MNNKRISCVAKNNEINDPKTRTVTVQMNRKKNYINGHLRTGCFLVRPQSVKILRKETYLTEGQKVHIVCEVENNCNILMKSPITFSLVQAQGSEPPAQIRWYLGESPQDNFKVEVKAEYLWMLRVISYGIIYLHSYSVFQSHVINFSISRLEAQPRVFLFLSQVRYLL